MKVIIRLSSLKDHRVGRDSPSKLRKERSIIAVHSFDKSSFNFSLFFCEHYLSLQLRPGRGLTGGRDVPSILS